MWVKRVCVLLTTLLACGAALATGPSGPEITTPAPGAKVVIDRVYEEGKVLVSVVDAAGEAVRGLAAKDFTVEQAGRTAQIVSVQPLTETVDVPRHIVLVLDNSFSMVERRAVKALLEGVGELLKIVRPIDDVRIVVFDDKASVPLGGRDLRVKTFASSKPAELQEFAAKAYESKNVTAKTVLYEAMLAGLELLRGVPATEPRFLVVFSDGEDINSAYPSAEVVKVAKGAEGFRPFAVDYMPVPALDEFLAKFTAENKGQAWKARSEANLVPIFQKVASTLEYYYVVTYRFPPKGSVSVSPAGLRVDRAVAVDAEGKPVTTAGAVLDTGLDAGELTLRPVVDTAYGIASWTATVANARGTVASLSGEGEPPAEVKVPLPSGDPAVVAAGGDLAVKLELLDKKGQKLALDAPAVKVAVAQTRGSLAVTPSTVTIDEVRVAGPDGSAAPVRSAVDPAALVLRPSLESPGWVARWKAVVWNEKSVVGEATGQGAPAGDIRVPLPTKDLQTLAAAGSLGARLELQDGKGRALLLYGPAVKVVVAQTRGSLTVAPAAVTVEEIKTIDSSPTLAHVYFDTGSGEIPARYKRFASPAETEGFDEQKHLTTLDKYYQLLNIVGRRLVADPSAKVTLVGCNDGTPAEAKKKGLSAQRAEAVKAYLQSVWGIAADRLAVEARGLPKRPSAVKTPEGQAENRRVEIVPSNPAIVAPTRSVYATLRIDAPALTARPDVTSPHGVERWQAAASNRDGTVAELKGTGAPARETKLPLDGGDLRKLAAGGDLTVKMEVQDKKGQRLDLAAAPVKMIFKQLSQQRTEKQDQQRVQERYALILFDFDKDTVGPANQETVDKIAARIKELPDCSVEIVGHTDNIGKEAYNLKLSQRRSATVAKLLTSALGAIPPDRLRQSGVGPNDPLYDNQSPEARGFNRTVTIVLEYLSAK